MSFEISCHLTFHVILRFMSFGVSCHLAFHVIWRFMSFCVSCNFAFHVILRFMSFGVSCHSAFHVILRIIAIIVTKVLNGINAQVVIEDRCVLKKWLPPLLRIVIGRYCYKSSFGAKNDRPGDDGTLRSV